jgi:ABC-type uncharacterized transport system permease subunit
MTASMVMAVAILLYIIARWSRNQTALTIGGVVSGLFAIFIIALLDQGKTEQIAKGLAWLFFIGAAYNAIPPVTRAAARGAKSGTSQAKQTLA